MSKVIDNLEAHRQERNEEMELLRGQVDEMAELKRNNDLLETHCKTLNDQLEADRNEARERYIDLITCILQILHETIIGRGYCDIHSNQGRGRLLQVLLPFTVNLVIG